MTKKICIDGIRGSGKSTICNLLRESYPTYEIYDSGILTQLADIYPDEHPESLTDILHIILDAEVDICHDRISTKNIKLSDKDDLIYLFKYKNRFIRLAIEYQISYIDTSNQSIRDTYRHVVNIIEGNDTYLLPNPDLIDVSHLPILMEDSNKIWREFNYYYNIIELKPIVITNRIHKEIIGTDTERMQMMKNMLFLLEENMIRHAYIYIGKKYILARHLDLEHDTPNIEIIVNKYCTDGYMRMNYTKTRFGTSLLEKNNAYPQEIVSFNWLNSFNKIEILPDMLANYLIDVEKSRELAIKTFNILKDYFNSVNISIDDIHLRITTDGTMLWSEISQATINLKLKNKDKCNALEQQIWANQTGNLMLEKWSLITQTIHEHSKNKY